MLYIILMHICYFMFFANDLLLDVYFIFILDMKMMLDRKQIWAIFLFQFKIGGKAVEITRNINNAFGWGTTTNVEGSGSFKKFCKGDESLEDEEHSGWPSEVGKINWEQSTKLIRLQLYGKLLNNSTLTIVWLFGIWRKLETWKNFKWVLHELTANQKFILFEVLSSLILCKDNELFLDQIVMCDEKWVL